MRKIGKQGLRSNLVERVKRHSNLSTLFHSPGFSSVSDRTLNPMSVQRMYTIGPTEDVVQASLLPPTSSLPLGYLVSQIIPGLSLRPEVELNGDVNHTPHPAEPAVQANEVDSPTLPGIPHDEKQNPSDKAWQRLQTIFRKHQVKTAEASPGRAQKESSIEDSLPTPVSREEYNHIEAPPLPMDHQPAEMPGKQEDGAKQWGLSAEQEGITSESLIQTRTDKRQGLETSAISERPLQRKIGDDSELNREKGTPSSARESSAQAREIIRADDGNHEVKITNDSLVIDTSPKMDHAKIQTSPAEPDNLSRRREENDISQDQLVPPLSHPGSGEGENSTELTLYQSIPLETAWPVQRKRVAAEIAPPSRLDSESDFSMPEYPPGSEVSETLSNADTEACIQENNDLIEVIPPRQRHPLKKIPSDTQINPGTQLRKVDIREPLDQPDGQDLLQTAIGPLPADLWHLLGTPPPRMKTAQPKVTEESSPGTGIHPVVGDKATPAAPSSIPSFSSGRDEPGMKQNFPAVVQREPMAAQSQIPQATSVEALTPRNPAIAAPSQIPEKERNIDELARQVYTELRHRLAIEAERIHQCW